MDAPPSLPFSLSPATPAALVRPGSPLLRADLGGRQASFASILARSGPGGGRDSEGAARGAAEEIVSVTLVQPLLSQLRESSMAAAPFAPTRREAVPGA